jgi:hypothetical protein
MQIIDREKYKGGKIVPDISDWEKLDAHIGTCPFVLLIDEMNALCFPIGSEVMKILKTYFLDKINRFLVVSSHIPLHLDDDNGVFRNSVLSKRPTKIVELPVSNDLTKLREMGPSCHNLNHKIVNYYGRIPSLMYAERESKDSSPTGRFYKYNWGGTTHNSDEFYDFVEELLDGKKVHNSVRVYDKLSSSIGEGLGRWPPCYVSCIITLFSQSIPGVEALQSAFKALETYQESVDKGKWWEELVAIVLILRCCAASGRSYQGPFGITKSSNAVGSLVSFYKFGEEIKTLKEANNIIDQQIRNVTSDSGSFIIFVPSFASFPQFDGFIVFTKIGKTEKFGYQCKHGKEGSHGQKPSCLDKVILLRGNAYNNSTVTRGWAHWNKEQVIELLGVSFEILYPDNEDT